MGPALPSAFTKSLSDDAMLNAFGRATSFSIYYPASMCIKSKLVVERAADANSVARLGICDMSLVLSPSARDIVCSSGYLSSGTVGSSPFATRWPAGTYGRVHRLLDAGDLCELFRRWHSVSVGERPVFVCPAGAGTALCIGKTSGLLRSPLPRLQTCVVCQRIARILGFVRMQVSKPFCAFLCDT